MTAQTIFVTGGSRGLGLAIVETLLGQGHSVASFSRSVTSELQALKDKYPETLLITQGDLTDADATTAALERVIATSNGLDSMILNGASPGPLKRMVDVTPSELAEVYAANVLSILPLYRAALPSLRKSGGRLIVLSSGASEQGFEGTGAYAGTKAAVNRIVEVLGLEEPDVTFIAVNPGLVKTDMSAAVLASSAHTMKPETHERIKAAHAAGMAQPPAVPAAAIAALALRAPKELSGRYIASFGPEAKALLEG
ncbi:NAD(P)-binding protein [Exidia glandulosa HHB12029]|uniref:NAD(P)-binding protein n=1 Tax=Exidia glandulosa HHB12029 TaxID=1314781 RepID=A0A165I7B3_EXIGL|nr:NAD(P)-binding protein [Exidia glandulosa HHB12029]